MELRTCVTDEDYEAWREVRLAVVPDERTLTVAEMREMDSPERVLLLAVEDGTVLGSGLGDRSDAAGGGFVTPRVLPEHRRRGVGSALLHALADHCAGLGYPEVHASVDDEESLAFARHFGFVEVDREVEQVRTISDEPAPPAPPQGVDVVELSTQPHLWAECYPTFGAEVLADFAVYSPLEISAEQWQTTWRGDPMFLAVADGEVVGCAGLNRDSDQPGRAENALTGVRRDWRRRGIAEHLKRRTLNWAAAHDVREVYTWTQAGNAAMIHLNHRLGYVTRKTAITLSRELPL